MKRKVVGICSIIFVIVCTFLIATMNVSKADPGETVDGITYEFRVSGRYLYELRVVDVPEGMDTISLEPEETQRADSSGSRLLRLHFPFPVISSFRPGFFMRSRRVTAAPCRAAVIAATRPEAPAPITNTVRCFIL